MDYNKENRKSTLRNRREDQQENFDFIPIPETEWVFKTPPGQRIPKPKLAECTIQPAVVCTGRKTKALFEINANATKSVDLSQLTKGTTVPCDNKYVKHIGTFKDAVFTDDGMAFLEPLESCYSTISELSSSFRLSRLQKTKDIHNENKPY